MSKKFIRKLALGLGFIVLTFFLFLYLILQAYIDDRSHGRIRLSAQGLSIQSTVFEKEGRSVMLLGLIHVADERFYQEISQLIPKGNTIVLLEGVEDAQKIAGQALNYSRLARWFGVSYQDKHFDQIIKAQQAYLYADVHTDELSPESRKFLELLGTIPEISDKMRASISEDFDQELWDRAEASFQKERNQKLLVTFDKVAPTYTTIAIPWGVLHHEEFSKALKTRGYRVTKNIDITAIKFWD